MAAAYPTYADASAANLVYVQQLPSLATHPTPAGFATLRTMQLYHSLTAAIKKQGCEPIEEWVADNFHRDGKVKMTMLDERRVPGPDADYVIPVCALARFYETMRRSGAINFNLLLDNPAEWVIRSGDGVTMSEATTGHIVECDQMTLVVGYANGSTVFSKGSCRVTYDYQQADATVFDANGVPVSIYPQTVLLISSLEYEFIEHNEMIARSAIKSRRAASKANSPKRTASTARQRHFSAQTQPSTSRRRRLETEEQDPSTILLDNSESTRPAKRPKVESESDRGTSAYASPAASEKEHSLDRSKVYSSDWQEYSIPVPPVAATGLCDEAMRVLEIGEAVDHLGELICFSLVNKLSPLDALEHYATLSVATGFAQDPASLSFSEEEAGQPGVWSGEGGAAVHA